MFTISHAIGPRDDDRRTLYSSKNVWFHPEKDGAPAFMEILDHGEIRIFDEGIAIVMNDNGKTVAKYKLG